MPITNAVLAQKISDLIDSWNNRELEMQAWISGTSSGGPGLDGKFPLTDSYGVVRLTKSPARLEADVSGPVASAETYATAADGSKVAALAAQAAAEAASTLALGYKNDAVSARDLASGYASTAGTHAANAAGAASNALASETSATASAAAAALDAADAETARAAAVVAQLAAEAAAAAAATFNPALYALVSHTHTDADLTGTINADTLGTYPMTAGGNRWGVIPAIGADGVMEAGKYIDFHDTDADAGDYSVRLTTSSGAIDCSGTFSATALSCADGNGVFVNGVGGTKYIANITGTYGSIRVGGSTNGYAGIQFIGSYQSRRFMFETANAIHGVYSEIAAAWDWVYNGTTFLVNNQTRSIPRCEFGAPIITRGTAAPSGGSDGDIYLQYT
jgi:hypothetical protein